MKRRTLWPLLLCLSFLCFGTVMAQNEPVKRPKKEIEVKKRTLMELYEPDMVLSVEERIQLKRNRMEAIQKGKAILDTIAISNRRKRRLLKKLYRQPFSDRLTRAIADNQFQDNAEN